MSDKFVPQGANNLERVLSVFNYRQNQGKAELNELKQAVGSLASPTITVTPDGVVNVNDVPQAAKIVTPATVATEVGKVLSNDTTPSELLKQQQWVEASYQLSNLKLAVQRGTYYIEDALPEDLRNKVYTKWYETNERPDEALQIVRLIQEAMDKLPENVVITTRGGFFPFTKNVGYASDFYGADNRQITRGGMLLTINGQQPCLTFRKSKFRVYDFSLATFCVEESGQDAFHLCDGSEGNVILHLGKVVTRAYLKFGYKEGADLDKMLFPPIDGWTKEAPHIGTGCADKGTAEAGFNTTTLPHDLSCYMNNAAVVENVSQPAGFNRDRIKTLYINQASERYRSAGGYFDAEGVSRFPQDDGTTSTKWGKWRGGQRGSRGYALRIFGAVNTVVKNFFAAGFTGGAVACGLYGTPSGGDVAPWDVQKSYQEGMVAVNTKIEGGYFTHNYTSGVEAIRVSGWVVTGIYCPDSVVGHPDAHLEHIRGWNNSVVSLDPGYQQCTSRYLPMDNIYVLYNVFGLGKRKVVDVHTGTNVKVIGNSGRAMYYGISTVIEEVFAGTDRRGTTNDPHSFYYQDSNIEVSGNTFVSGNIGLHPINGATGVKARRDAGLWWLNAHQVWSGNIVYAPRGMACNFGHNHFIVEKNIFNFALPYGQVFGLHYVSGFVVENQGGGYTSPPEVFISGGGDGAFGAVGEAKVSNGKVTDIVLRCIGSRYTEVPTVTLVGGGGQGAKARASVNTSTYGMNVGAENRYGTILASTVEKNYVRNTPEGNYARQFLIGNLTGCLIAGNHMDTTPYKSAGKAGAPYVSQVIKHRDGLGSQGFYQTGKLNRCTVLGNFEHNQLADTVRPWIGTHTDYVNTMYEPPAKVNPAPVTPVAPPVKEQPAPVVPVEKPQGNSESATPQVQQESKPAAAKPETALPDTNPTAKAPEPASPGSGSQADEEVPAVEEPVQDTKTIALFNFDNAEVGAESVNSSIGSAVLTSLLNRPTGKNPTGWSGAVVQVGDGQAFTNMSSTGSGTASRYSELTGISGDGVSEHVMILPFMVNGNGGSPSPTGAHIALFAKDNTPVRGFAAIAEEEGFRISQGAGFTVNGRVITKAIAEGHLFDYGKMYIAVVRTNGEYNKVRFGTNHVMSAWRNVTIGKGMVILKGPTPEEVTARYEALKELHGIEKGEVYEPK